MISNAELSACFESPDALKEMATTRLYHRVEETNLCLLEFLVCLHIVPLERFSSPLKQAISEVLDSKCLTWRDSETGSTVLQSIANTLKIEHALRNLSHFFGLLASAKAAGLLLGEENNQGESFLSLSKKLLEGWENQVVAQGILEQINALAVLGEAKPPIAFAHQLQKTEVEVLRPTPRSSEREALPAKKPR